MKSSDSCTWESAEMKCRFAILTSWLDTGALAPNKITEFMGLPESDEVIVLPA